MGMVQDLFLKFNMSQIIIPQLNLFDIIDITIVALLIYKVVTWIKGTRAWTLFKGIAVIFLMASLAYLLQLTTITWIFSKTISVGIIAAIILFQPELRRALEQLGRGGIMQAITRFEEANGIKKEALNTKSIDAIVNTAMKLSAGKVGALIVIEQEVRLGEYENTGIFLDSKISEQLLINIFEHNTPLHDGAVIVKENRISSATCYLPLTDDLEISKSFGTRHRAAIGVTEISDAIVVVVSEETGSISFARSGKINYNISPELLKSVLMNMINQKKKPKNKISIWKGKEIND
ncbi:MAG: diadenylate cyclase CdaA [Clostridia bacterium]|jgi:diadenylate cyclase|nr:diadenylate cyclase CdaA [Clostridia bacterium]